MSDPIGGNWYAANAQRGYPVDDGATGVDDVGFFLPHDLLVDATVALPRSLASGVFVTALTATANVVTVVLAADDASRTPVAACTVAAPVTANRAYPLEALEGGVGGWVAFGPGLASGYSGRFSTPAQSRLLARCVRAYGDLPVPSLGKYGLEATLSGVVTLLGGQDVEVVAETVRIDGTDRLAIVVRLADTLDRNVFARYAGACNGRPESGTCNKPALQSVAGVVPDCLGNIDVDFRGLRAIATPGGGGITMALALGMADACGNRRDGTGSLSGVYRNACEVYDSSHG